jgi:hypothetical protein
MSAFARRAVRVAIGALLFAVLAWALWHARSPQRGANRAAARPDTVAAGLKAVRLYFAAPSGDSLVGEARDLVEGGTLHDRVTALVAELDRGPLHANAVAALPAGTSVLHVYLDDRGQMTLDLSRAFVQGFHGGSTAEYLAIASLVRTMADNVPEVKRLLLVCGGEPLSTLGGHLPLDRPIDVSDWP